jgi:NAD+ kinase
MFSPSRKLRMKVTTTREDSMVINVDGEHFISLTRDESIEICRGRNNINFIDLIGNSFHESLCKKMCKPIK